MTYTRVVAASSRIIFQVPVMILKVLGGLRRLLVTIGLDLMFLKLYSFPGMHNGTTSDHSLP